MPITVAQLETRKKHIGSSDMAAILGLDSYRNAYDVWLEKTDKIEAEIEKDGDNSPRSAGKILEPAVLQFAENRIGKLTRNQYRSAKDKGLPLGANVDGILNSTGQPIEAKTSGLYGFSNDIWGEENTDQVPDRVVIQSHVHHLCTDKDICFVPAFITFRGFLMFQVPRDAEIIDIIAEESVRFWDKHVLADVPPENLVPHLAIAKRLKREAGKTVPIDYSLIENWKNHQAVESAAKKEKESALAAILAALGDAEAGECELGKFTNFEQTRSAYSVPESTYRVGRFSKHKEKK